MPNKRGVGKTRNFQPISRRISETVQDRTKVTINVYIYVRYMSCVVCVVSSQHAFNIILTRLLFQS